MTHRPLRLPRSDGSLETFTFSEPRQWARSDRPPIRRTAYAAVHVVADPLANNTADGRPSLDWDATLAFRRHIWSWGLGVAEAMDTAQRGSGLTWDLASELIRRTAEEAATCNGLLACGVSTDSLPDANVDISQILDAYLSQLELVEAVGATPVIMASQHLAQAANNPEDYATVYGKLLEQTTKPAILHWLGEAFAPALAGYWGSADLDEATRCLLNIVHDNHRKVSGVKLSLLDKQREREFRRSLPEGVTVLTGDDFHYPELVLGDDKGGSDALLGIFDPIAPVAAAALRALDHDDVAQYWSLLAPTVPLARHLFEAPTYNYKTGIVFLAWLAGHQNSFIMLRGLQSARSLIHLVEGVRLADNAGLIADPDDAARRLGLLLAVHGVDQWP